MGVVAACRGRRVYLDANIFIYAVEASTEYLPTLTPLFELFADGGAAAVASELALAEVLPRPLEAGRPDIATLYEEMLTSSAWLTVLPITRTILVAAARLRPQLRLRLPDAIHVATAVAAGCPILLSNDLRLKVPAGLQLLPLGSGAEGSSPK
jgi:predicted nucleic acid-binding protein